MEEENKIKKLKKLISGYLQEYTLNPAVKSIEEDVFVAYKLGNVLVTLKVSEQLIGDIGYKLSPVQSLNVDKKDIQRLESIVERDECRQCEIDFIGHLESMTCSKSCLLPYIDKEINWIVVSILCSSYLSSLILMRSVFELLINISTTQNGGMSAKVEGIPFFEDEEKRAIKRTWKELCSWGHPFKKWLENFCPIYISHKPIYHPRHFEDCVNLLERILDVYLVISKEHFGMNINAFREKREEVPMDFSNFPLFQRRLEGI